MESYVRSLWGVIFYLPCGAYRPPTPLSPWGVLTSLEELYKVLGYLTFWYQSIAPEISKKNDNIL